MSRDYSHRLIVQEVAPRDGLQIEPTWVETDDKIALIDQLSACGFTRIEAGSFVSPKAIPALARRRRSVQPHRPPSGRDLCRADPEREGRRTRARRSRRRTQPRDVREPDAQPREHAHELRGIASRASAISCGVAGTTVSLNAHHRDRVRLPVRRTHRRGRACSISSMRIARWACTASRSPTRPAWRIRGRSARLVGACSNACPPTALTLHFHNTRGLGLANVLAASACRRVRFDAALGGLGGCPFAPGAIGQHLHRRPREPVRRDGHSDRHRPADADRTSRALPRARRPRRARAAGEGGTQ